MNPTPKTYEEGERLPWILFFVFLSVLGAVAYRFFVFTPLLLVAFHVSTQSWQAVIFAFCGGLFMTLCGCFTVACMIGCIVYQFRHRKPTKD
jgi:hypothetical protein